MRACWVRALPLSLLLLLAPARAEAADFEVEAETVGQGYQLKGYTPLGASVLLDRRRLTQYLNLHAFRLLPDEMTGERHDRNQLYFTSSMRFDTDFGNYLQDAPSGQDRIRELPRAQSVDEFQLLYAVLGGNNMFGFLDFQLGRQIVFDLMDFYSFDGLDVRVRLPWWFALEAWSGLEVRNEAPLASPIYELDGTSQGSRDPATCLWLARGANQPFPGCADQNSQLAPTFGFALESWGLQIFHGRLAYRRTFAGTAGDTAGGLLPDSGVDEEKLSYTINASLKGFRPFAGIRYNLLVGQWDEVDAGLQYTYRGHRILGEWIYNLPTFDGDSIFNIFALYAYNDLRVNYATPLYRGRWQFWGTGFLRFFSDAMEIFLAENPGCNPVTNPCPTQPNTASAAYGITAGGRYGLSHGGWVRAEGYYENGFGGKRAGIDSSVLWTVLVDTLALEGRLTLVDFQDDLLPESTFQKNNYTYYVKQNALSVGFQAGARYQMAHGVYLHGLLEENNNRYYNYQLRALALLDLTFAK